ncbi:hypothetical protein ACQCVP_13485 [Rossellomorea vietnamensis]|uniref:hypothetical protein n=1 Tax=Rossellomorea vietnamensis TaxID=218284 RepID=UPI003CF62ED6
MEKPKKTLWINFVGFLLILWSIGSFFYFNQAGYSSSGIFYITIIGQTLLGLFFVSLAIFSFKNKNQREFSAYIFTSIVLFTTVIYLTFNRKLQY